MKVQQYLLVILLTISSFVLSSCGGGGAKITEGDVLNIISQMEQAAISHDISIVQKSFSKNATITLDLPPDMGGKQEMFIDDYMVMLQQGWAMPATFTYEVKDVQVSVAPDGMSATVTDVTIETVEMDGQVMSTETNERLEIISDNGKPVISSVYGKVNMAL